MGVLYYLLGVKHCIQVMPLYVKNYKNVL